MSYLFYMISFSGMEFTSPLAVERFFFYSQGLGRDVFDRGNFDLGTGRGGEAVCESYG